jgi:hypothetical protein
MLSAVIISFLSPSHLYSLPLSANPLCLAFTKKGRRHISFGDSFDLRPAAFIHPHRMSSNPSNSPLLRLCLLLRHISHSGNPRAQIPAKPTKRGGMMGTNQIGGKGGRGSILLLLKFAPSNLHFSW